MVTLQFRFLNVKFNFRGPSVEPRKQKVHMSTLVIGKPHSRTNASAIFLGLLLIICRPVRGQDPGPNILLIVADDLGYADVGFQGCLDIPTPHLDQLASQSVRFTNAYVTHPFCSPTRAGLLTGRYQQRFGYEYNPAWEPRSTLLGLPLSETTLPQVLKTAGYTTGAVGKWHLGAHPQFHPNQLGFDEYFGLLGGGHVYLPGSTGFAESTIPMDRNGQSEPLEQPLTELLGQEASAFITARQATPWFLYLSFNAPHVPLQPTQLEIDRVQHITDVTRRKYAGLVVGMDDAIGEVMATLKSTGQEDNTLIWFMSDNGGAVTTAHGSNVPLRGEKGRLFEGGVRVPSVMSWPQHIAPGTTFEAPVTSLDVFATVAALTQAVVPENHVLEGVNLLPHLSGDITESPHDQIFWRTGGGTGMAIREGDWKLVSHDPMTIQLYDLSNDIGETNDLASANPEIVARLLQAWQAWNASNVEPSFRPSVSISGTTVSIRGTELDDLISVQKIKSPVGSTWVRVEVNQNTHTVSAGLTSIIIDGFEGNDQVTIHGYVKVPAILRGGAGDDMLTGGGGDDTLEGNAGQDILNGGIGSDILVGGSEDDTYTFGAVSSLTEAESIIELADEGTDTLDFSSQPVAVSVDLGTTLDQSVHIRRRLQLNAVDTIENAIGGARSDVLTGNSLANSLTGGPGNDRLTGSVGDDVLDGGMGDDTYVFAAAMAAEADTVTEGESAGTDTLNFSGLTTDVVLTLETSLVQTVHVNRTLKLNSGVVIERALTGSGNDILTGNALPNSLTGGAGNDQLTGSGGNDLLLGGTGDDTYVFGAAPEAEADTVTEGAGSGADTLDFSGQTSEVVLKLGSSLVQVVHVNRMLKLNSGAVIESAVGGSGNDILSGNSLANSLTGGEGHDILIGSAGDDQLLGSAGSDILIGGIGQDNLDGGDHDDILIAGRTSSDGLFNNLNDLRTEWTSAIFYQTRIDNLRMGVGASRASLKTKINVVNDAGAIDTFFGRDGLDWYFRALDDVISDLMPNEIVDAL